MYSMVCLDTSFIVALIRRDPKAEKRLENYVASEVKLSTTPIAVCELFKGAYRSRRREIEVGKVRDVLTHLEVLDFSVEACERYGKLVSDLQLMGSPIGDLDAMIACIASTYNEPILTSDKKHFEKVQSLSLIHI